MSKYRKLALKASELIGGDCDMTTKEGRANFVWGTWYMLAPIGYEAFLTKGRGAVVIVGGKDGPKGDPQYLLAGTPNNGPELEKMIREYNPETDIVILYDLTFTETGQFYAVGTYGLDNPAETPPALWAKWRSEGPKQ